MKNPNFYERQESGPPSITQENVAQAIDDAFDVLNRAVGRVELKNPALRLPVLELTDTGIRERYGVELWLRRKFPKDGDSPDETGYAIAYCDKGSRELDPFHDPSAIILQPSEINNVESLLIPTDEAPLDQVKSITDKLSILRMLILSSEYLYHQPDKSLQKMTRVGYRSIESGLQIAIGCYIEDEEQFKEKQSAVAESPVLLPEEPSTEAGLIAYLVRKRFEDLVGVTEFENAEIINPEVSEQDLMDFRDLLEWFQKNIAEVGQLYGANEHVSGNGLEETERFEVYWRSGVQGDNTAKQRDPYWFGAISIDRSDIASGEILGVNFYNSAKEPSASVTLLPVLGGDELAVVITKYPPLSDSSVFDHDENGYIRDFVQVLDMLDQTKEKLIAR